MPLIEFAASDGTRLEGRLTTPTDARGGVAVVCHPHPRFGGSMDSWMMPVLQRALVTDGWVGLRFNFRGVGGSGGSHGGGEPELLDVRAAVERVREEGTGPLLLVGWSFGAVVSLRYAVDDERVAGWVGVGLTAASGSEEAPLDREPLGQFERPKLFIHGTRDRFTSVEEIERVVAAAAEPKRLHLVPGGDHFLAAHGDVLSEQLQAFGRELRGA